MPRVSCESGFSTTYHLVLYNLISSSILNILNEQVSRCLLAEQQMESRKGVTVTRHTMNTIGVEARRGSGGEEAEGEDTD
jgi:hypothetical protein